MGNIFQISDFIITLELLTNEEKGKYTLRVSDPKVKPAQNMDSPPSLCRLSLLNEPEKGGTGNCHLIKFALADSHSPPMMTGDEMVDTLGLLWVVTDRCIPRAGLMSEELTIYYGDEYVREGYERGYWARAPSTARAPTAKDMAHIGSQVLRNLRRRLLHTSDSIWCVKDVPYDA